ncbi:MAG: hypothetical protein JWM11_8015 [Planctomycetaceae bacterium]|nr:hypothetical protein [Planctomycetaceae bacterium]
MLNEDLQNGSVAHWHLCPLIKLISFYTSAKRRCIHSLPDQLRSIRLQRSRRIGRALNFSALWLGGRGTMRIQSPPRLELILSRGMRRVTSFLTDATLGRLQIALQFMV